MTILFRALLALVVLSPLAIGAVYMWAWSLAAVVIALLLAAWGILQLRAGGAPPVPLRRIWPALAAFAAVVVWAALQASGLTPAAWHHPLWATAAGVLGREVAASVSLNPFEGGSALLRLLAYGGVFWLALQLCRDRARAETALLAVAISGAVYAAYGIGVHLSGTNTILWFAKTSYLDVVTSTFVNRNSYATFAGLGLIAGTGAIIRFFESRLPQTDNRRELAHAGLSLAFGRGWPLVVAWILLFVALLMTQSRGGFVAAVAGLGTLLLSAGLRGEGRRRLVRGLGLGIVAAAAVFVAVGGGAVLDRLSATPGQPDIRAGIYARTAEAISDAPVLGTGYGSFPDVYRFYRPPDHRMTVARAHNTYLENALELGIPAAALLTLAVAGLGALCAAGVVRRRRDAIYPCVGVVATALVGVHSLFDFSLQIPAVAFTFSLLLGLGCAQAWSTRAP